MAALPNPFYIRGAGAQGDKDGTSFANAAGLDANAADDGWDIINASDAIAANSEIYICGGGTVGATCAINHDASWTYRLTIKGRDATDGTTDAVVSVDANGGAFPVFTLTACDYWTFENIRATNTDKNANNSAFYGGAGASYCVFINCRGDTAYRGFELTSGIHIKFLQCYAHDNGESGFFMDVGTAIFSRCVAHDNVYGIYGGLAWVDCLCYDNSSHGFYGLYTNQMLAANCVSHNNGGAGFYSVAHAPGYVYTDCIATENTTYGWQVSTSIRGAILLRCADYLNTTERTNSGTGQWNDIDPIALTADPFTAKGSGDFSLNSTAGGGTACRGIEADLPGGLTTIFADVGAAQHEDAASGGSRNVIIGG